MAAMARSRGEMLFLVEPRCDHHAGRAMKQERLKVLTLNIHKGLSHFNRRMVLHDLREGLQSLNPDVVFLQEVQGLNQRFAMRFAGAPVEPQHAFLAGDTWQHVYGCNAVYDHGHPGTALLPRSRFPSVE